MNNPSLIIFDMDGLMIDSEAKWQKAWKLTGEKYGFDFGDSLFLKLVGISGKDVDPIVKEVVNGDPTKYIEEARALGARLIEQEGFDCKPGLFELLDKIDELGIKKAVATTTERMTAKKHLERIGIYGRFDYIVCGDEVSKRKPDPEIYLKVLEYFNCSGDQALVLEDSPHGVQAAYNAKIPCIMIPDLIAPGSLQFVQTKMILPSLSDLIKFL